MAAAERVRRQMALALDARSVPVVEKRGIRERGRLRVRRQGGEDRHVGLPRRKEDLSDPRPTVCCPVAPCFDERPCLHPAFFTSLEATVFRARLIRA
jgi:hypothetical protein